MGTTNFSSSTGRRALLPRSMPFSDSDVLAFSIEFLAVWTHYTSLRDYIYLLVIVPFLLFTDPKSFFLSPPNAALSFIVEIKSGPSGLRCSTLFFDIQLGFWHHKNHLSDQSLLVAGRLGLN